MNKQRLLKLADFLETVPQDKFDMSHWYKGELTCEAIKNDCGTVACACGWAVFLFKDEKGSSLELVNQGNLNASKQLVYRTKKGSVFQSYAAAAKFFNISIKNARYLFAPTSYDGTKHMNIVELCNSTVNSITPLEVSDRIRNFVKEDINLS